MTRCASTMKSGVVEQRRPVDHARQHRDRAVGARPRGAVDPREQAARPAGARSSTGCRRDAAVPRARAGRGRGPGAAEGMRTVGSIRRIISAAAARVNRFSSVATIGGSGAPYSGRGACGSRSSPPSASRGPRPAASPTSSMRSRGRSARPARARARRPRRRLPARATGACRCPTGAVATPSPCRTRVAGKALSTRHPRRRDPRLPAAPRRPPAGVRSRRPVRRRRTATTPTTRGGSGCCAAPRWSTCAWHERPPDVIHIHDWHAAPARPAARRRARVGPGDRRARPSS